MANIAPFPGLRYNPKKVPELSKVVAPPYDVINDVQRRRLAARHRNNIVHVILPVEEGGRDCYANAAEILGRWLDEGVLVEDARPGIYVVRQEWQAGGKNRHRTGFIAAVRLEPFGEGKIYPHENTLSAPKEDRLKLLKATHTNLSQVFSIFPDPGRDVDAWMNALTVRPPHARATDDAGVVTKLWCEFDDVRIAGLAGMMAEREIFIADGHHRYETALAYRQYCIEKAAELPSDAPENAIMMLCVAMNNEGLITLPTHRLLPAEVASPDLLTARLKSQFDVHPIATFSGKTEELDALLANDTSPNLMLLYAGKGRPPLRVSPKDGRNILAHIPHHGDAWRSLDVSILQVAIFEKLLGLTLEHVTKGARIGYVHESAEAVHRVDSGEFAAAFILRPTPVSAVAEVASRLEKMPPKSTFFYPKALTGIVLRRLG